MYRRHTNGARQSKQSIYIMSFSEFISSTKRNSTATAAISKRNSMHNNTRPSVLM